MRTRTRNHGPKANRESGQTIALVAVAMFSLLAIAALAIDLTTLYVAHGEIQRAADAAALAGAKAFVDSGITTSPSNGALQTLANNLATEYATQVLRRNNVAGAPANFINGTPMITLNISVSGNTNVLLGNPRITVTVQRTDLPVFFAKIFGNTAASVSATAMAEAFNPAYSQANAGLTIPPAPKCVKPFLVANSDQIQGIPFVDKTTGAITAAPLPFIGETITLASACGFGPCGTNPKQPGAGQYLPMWLQDIHHYCPSSSAGPTCSGGNNFEKSIKCCDGTAFDYQQCGVSAGKFATWNQTGNSGGPGGDTQEGLQCLIHTSSIGPSPQQDLLDTTQANNGLLRILPGTYSQSLYNVSAESAVSTSDSIITVPLIDVPALWPPANNQVTIVGFLQLFVNYVGPNATDMNATILNVIGCGTPPTSATAVSGDGVSAIPVRLIHN